MKEQAREWQSEWCHVKKRLKWAFLPLKMEERHKLMGKTTKNQEKKKKDSREVDYPASGRSIVLTIQWDSLWTSELHECKICLLSEASRFVAIFYSSNMKLIHVPNVKNTTIPAFKEFIFWHGNKLSVHGIYTR